MMRLASFDDLTQAGKAIDPRLTALRGNDRISAGHATSTG
jgi:hypothetical protein